MDEIKVRLLGEADWGQYRSVRLAALQDAPNSFVNTFEEESTYEEQVWRDRMNRSRRLLAEREGEVVGVVCVGSFNEDPEVGDLFGLWVAPDARTSGVAYQLVHDAARQAARDGHRKLYYWVGNENAPAIGFAANYGFRVTSDRRAARVQNEDFGTHEVAMVLALNTDPSVVPNSKSASGRE